jgi:hypothetical protein
MKARLWYASTWLICVGTILPLAGCVRRTMKITTEPTGAKVTLNDRQIGTSPVSVDFTWYGDYSVQLEKEGYETLKTNRVVTRPWYQYAPVDFVAEVLIPARIHDERTLHFELTPEGEPPAREQLIEDAESLRQEALFGQD